MYFVNFLTARVLQDGSPDQVSDETDTTTTGNTGSTTATDDDTSIGISPAGFTGYIFSIFAFIAVVAGFQIMADIKSPGRFYKDQLQIGKEH